MRYIEPPRRNLFSYILPFFIIIGLGVCGFFAFRDYLMANILLHVEPLPNDVQVTYILGENVSVLRYYTSEKESLNLVSTIQQGDIVSTRAASYVELQLFDGTIVRLRENSAIAFSRLERTSRELHISLNLLEGEAYIQSAPLPSPSSDILLVTPRTISRLKEATLTAHNSGDERVSVISGSVGLRLSKNFESMNSQVADTIILPGSEIIVDTESWKKALEGERIVPRRSRPASDDILWYLFTTHPEIVPRETR